jgi:hypothetical protein
VARVWWWVGAIPPFPSCASMACSGTALLYFYSVMTNYSILSCSVLFCSILFSSVLFCFGLFCSIMFYFILLHSVLLYSILLPFCSIVFYSILLYSFLFSSVPFIHIWRNKNMFRVQSSESMGFMLKEVNYSVNVCHKWLLIHHSHVLYSLLSEVVLLNINNILGVGSVTAFIWLVIILLAGIFFYFWY